MDTRTQSDKRGSRTDERAMHDGETIRHEHPEAGIDLPIFGHVGYKSVGFLAGLGVAGAVGVIEWPVAAAVGIGYALARQGSAGDVDKRG